MLSRVSFTFLYLYFHCYYVLLDGCVKNINVINSRHIKKITEENIIEAVKREVLEETGIETEFVSLVCFRHLLNFRFGCSDVYFICHLRPLTQEIKMDTREIADAQWMDVSI